MSDKIVEMLEEQASRRGFFGRLGTACMALVAALIGLPQPAAALRSVYCCLLCGNDCTSGCPFGCVWGWDCCHNGTKYRCAECYFPGGGCDVGSCRSYYCSRAYSVGSC